MLAKKLLAIQSGGGGAPILGPPTILGLRYGDSVSIINVSDWSTRSEFNNLSCGPGEFRPSSGLQFHTKNNYFITNGETGFGIYSIEDGSELFFNANTTQTTGEISRDGSKIAFGDINDVVIIDSTTFAELHRITQPLGAGNGYLSVSWSYDNTLLAIASERGNNYIIYNVDTYTPYSNIVSAANSINALSMSPDGTMLAIATDGSSTDSAGIVTAISPNMVHGDIAVGLGDGNRCRHILFSRDGTLLYTMSIDEANAYDTTSWLLSSTTGITNDFYWCAESGDSTMLVTNSNNSSSGIEYIVDASDLSINIPANIDVAAETLGAAWDNA